MFLILYLALELFLLSCTSLKAHTITKLSKLFTSTISIITVNVQNLKYFVVLWYDLQGKFVLSLDLV